MDPLTTDIVMLAPYDDAERFLVFCEQLEVAAELLETRTLARARAALVAVDNLADLLLHAHAERVFASGEGSAWMERKRWSARERKRIRGDFNKLVSIAETDNAAP